jgi:hypothetical protein
MGWWVATMTLTPRVDTCRPGKNYIFNALFISFLYSRYFGSNIKLIAEK